MDWIYRQIFGGGDITLDDFEYRTVSFKNIISMINGGGGGIIINTLPMTHQQCLIKNTVAATIEESIINEAWDAGNTNINIIIYGAHSDDHHVYKKYKQLQEKGFTNVAIYVGGLFEWLLLQSAYGADEFPTTSEVLNILDYAPGQPLYPITSMKMIGWIS